MKKLQEIADAGLYAVEKDTKTLRNLVAQGLVRKVNVTPAPDKGFMAVRLTLMGRSKLARSLPALGGSEESNVSDSTEEE